MRTTFIVGFPGETEACFERLLEFIRETGNSSGWASLPIHTKTAREPDDSSPGAGGQIKKARRDRAMAEQLKVAREVARSFVGREMRVLVEKRAGAGELARAGSR